MCGAKLAFFQAKCRGTAGGRREQPDIRKDEPRRRHRRRSRSSTPPRFDPNGRCVLCSYDGSRVYKLCHDCMEMKMEGGIRKPNSRAKAKEPPPSAQVVQGTLSTASLFASSPSSSSSASVSSSSTAFTVSDPVIPGPGSVCYGLPAGVVRPIPVLAQ